MSVAEQQHTRPQHYRTYTPAPFTRDQRQDVEILFLTQASDIENHRAALGSRNRPWLKT